MDGGAYLLLVEGRFDERDFESRICLENDFMKIK